MKDAHCFGQAALLVAAAVFTASGSCATTPNKCCQALANLPELKGQIYYPEQTSYSDRLETYFSLSAALPPWCMVLPENAKEVSKVITTIVKGQCPFGIRGGGHGTHALSNSVKDGVTIDLGSLNKTTYNKDTKIASVGPGGHWGDVYDVLTPEGVTVTGGRASSVGVGGFLLGGGNSFHSNTHGYGCDQVQNFEVVLADGRIVNANEKEQPLLWKALRGGSGNVGLVTRFDMHAIEFNDPSKPEIWGGLLDYNYKHVDASVDAFHEFTKNVEKDLYSSSILGLGYLPASGWYIRLYLDNADNKANPAAFDMYQNIGEPVKRTLRSGTMSNITGELIAAKRTYTIWITGAYENRPEILHFIAEKHEEVMAKLEDIIGTETGMFSEIQFQPITKPMISHAKGNNVMGLESRVAKGDGFLFMQYFGIESAKDEQTANPYIKKFLQDIEDYARSLDASWDWYYINYANSFQDPIRVFGPEAVETLKKASQKYDPDGVFQKLRHSGFKIPQ